jgi:hypothetical protein
MKLFGNVSTTALLLFLGFAAPAYAGQEKQDEKGSPPKQEQEAKPQKQEQARPEKQAQAKPEKQEQQEQEQAKTNKQQQQHTQRQAKGQQEHQQQQQAKSDKQQQDKSAKQEQQQAKGHSQQQASSSHGGPQRTQQAQATQRSQPELRLSDRGNGHIPDDRFRSHFGREHHFRMGNPVMVGGYSRFQYGGYWFGFVDPWPVGWYYTDSFYIDYVDGGYYMYNPYYPGARFAITVVI